jgi:hypothetical protein
MSKRCSKSEMLTDSEVRRRTGRTCRTGSLRFWIWDWKSNSFPEERAQSQAQRRGGSPEGYDPLARVQGGVSPGGSRAEPCICRIRDYEEPPVESEEVEKSRFALGEGARQEWCGRRWAAELWQQIHKF